MNPTRSDSDDSNPASSVSSTPTVRDSRNISPVDPRSASHVPAPIHTGQARHQDLGMGRPEVSQRVISSTW